MQDVIRKWENEKRRKDEWGEERWRRGKHKMEKDQAARGKMMTERQNGEVFFLLSLCYRQKTIKHPSFIYKWQERQRKRKQNVMCTNRKYWVSHRVSMFGTQITCKWMLSEPRNVPLPVECDHSKNECTSQCDVSAVRKETKWGKRIPRQSQTLKITFLVKENESKLRHLTNDSSFIVTVNAQWISWDLKGIFTPVVHFVWAASVDDFVNL